MKHLLIDCGHGGIDPSTGLYTTIGEKQYTFTDHVFKTVYEGVINRGFGSALTLKYPNSSFVAHPWIDTPLSHRVALANSYRKVHGDCIYLALHNNAASKSIEGPSNTARGMEIWTSPGYTPADPIATKIFYGLEPIVPKVRTDKFRDGDPDKEKLLYVTKNTVMPAVLIEFDFFDNWEAAQWLFESENQIACAESIAKTIREL